MTGSVNRLHRSILLLTAGLLFAGATLRSLLEYAGDDVLLPVLLLLLAWLALLALEAAVAPRLPSFMPLYLAMQTAIVVALLSRAESGDFFAVLFGFLSMQAMQRLGWRTAFLWIALFTPLTALPLTLWYDLRLAAVLAVIYAGVDVFLGLFALATRRAEVARAGSEALLGELAVANGELAAFSRRVERLATAAERHRLARELHDSVTQTVFTMNLTAQAAMMLLPRDRAAAAVELGRLEDLGGHALAEIGALGSELSTAEIGEEGLVAALRRHLAERSASDGLAVELAVEGGGEDALTAEEELCLFRIVQEALNNVVKHAHAGEAAIRLRLSPPRRLEVEDRGCGFFVNEGQTAGGMGLCGMRERAAEIGWSLRVTSAPGSGTRVVAEQGAAEAEVAAAAAPAEWRVQ